MWSQQGRLKTGTTGGNSLHPTQQWMEPNDDDDVSSSLCYRHSRHMVLEEEKLSVTFNNISGASGIRTWIRRKDN